MSLTEENFEMLIELFKVFMMKYSILDRKLSFFKKVAKNPINLCIGCIPQCFKQLVSKKRFYLAVLMKYAYAKFSSF